MGVIIESVSAETEAFMAFERNGIRRIAGPIILILTLTLILAHTYGKKQDAAVLTGANTTLVIDPGHGGIDSGAVGIDGTRESDLNLAIALKLRAMAELYGLENTLLRQDDRSLCDSKDYSEHRDLVHRTELTSAALNPVYISIHQNDYPTAQPRGSQVIYSGGEGEPGIRHDHTCKSFNRIISAEQTRCGACHEEALYPVTSDLPGDPRGMRLCLQCN